MTTLTTAELERWEIGAVQDTQHDEFAVASDATGSVERAKFFLAMRHYYEQLTSDPRALEEELAERRAWERTLADGLEPE
jgi:hypothetical protein